VRCGYAQRETFRGVSFARNDKGGLSRILNYSILTIRLLVNQRATKPILESSMDWNPIPVRLEEIAAQVLIELSGEANFIHALQVAWQAGEENNAGECSDRKREDIDRSGDVDHARQIALSL
jgi:hypothetical protein